MKFKYVPFISCGPKEVGLKCISPPVHPPVKGESLYVLKGVDLRFRTSRNALARVFGGFQLI